MVSSNGRSPEAAKQSRQLKKSLPAANQKPLFDVWGDVSAEASEPHGLEISPGDIFQIDGECSHWLACGSAGDFELWMALQNFDGRANMLLTDPPYGVDYLPSWRDERLHDYENRKYKRNIKQVAGDWEFEIESALDHFAGDVVYCWHSARYSAAVVRELEAGGYKIRSQIVWVKSQPVIGRGEYNYQHECCIYAVKAGEKSWWVGDAKQSTVWNIPTIHRMHGTATGDDLQTGHSTQKPIQCMARAIKNHESRTIIDPFLGSGTTMLAAERLGRTCYGIEIDPSICAMALQRMINAGCKVSRV